jgi:hypothetical protein
LAREQLYIDNKYIPLSKSINPSVTKSMADIAEPNKRKAKYTLTTKIPNSKEVQKVFTAFYEFNLVEYTNSSLQDITFNPTVKIDCHYLVDGETVLNGYLQVKGITQLNNNEITWKVVMFGTISNIFRGMGEEYLVDLATFDEYDNPGTPDTANSLTRWNHPYDKTVQAYSWATQVWDNTAGAYTPFLLGQGYVYILADLGLTTDLTNFDYDKIPMCIYAREYMNAIFKKNGFTWTSNFLDSTYFKSLIIPSSPTSLQLDDTDIDEREFTANTPNFIATGSATSGNVSTGITLSSLGIVNFTVESSDTGNNYNNTTGVSTIVNTGVYNYTASLEMSATFTPTTGVSVVCVSEIIGAVDLYVNGALAQSIPFYITYNDYPGSPSIGARTTDTAPTLTSNDANPEYLSGPAYTLVSNPALAPIVPRQVTVPNKYIASFQNVSLITGDTVDVRIRAKYRGLDDSSINYFYSSPVYYPGTATISLGATSTLVSKLVNTYPAYSSTLDITKAIPKKIKQKDFFMSIVKMFNLWVDTDPNDQNNLIIEPREDFLGTTIVNIQDKIAQDKPIEISPTGKLDALDFLYTYKKDKDHFNERYEGQWNGLYGERVINTTNDFVRGTKKNEVIFSPTPCVAPPLSNRVIPTIIQVDDNNTPKDTDFNIRILYYGGLKSCVSTWNHIHYPVYNTPDADVYGTYPYAGHFDDPFNPTEDINFGLVKELYYDDDIQTISITNNNLTNKYHLDMLNAYTDKRSKIVNAWVNLNPTDFRTWDFAKLYWFENAYWRLNKIANYNPTSESLTKCEFLYLADVGRFTDTSEQVFGGGGPLGPVTGPLGGGAIDADEVTPTKGTKNNQLPDGNNGTGRGQTIQGDNNNIASDSYRIEIQGDNNRVFQEAEDIKIQGDGNTIDAGVKNVTLINTDDLFIQESDVTYIGGVKVNPDSIGVPTAVEDISASQTVETDVKTYKMDTSGNDITMTFDLAFITYTEGQIWYFKKEHPDNVINLTASGGTIDGETTQTYSGDNDDIPVQYCGGTEFIIL